jgi:hypothetical protein
MAQTLPYLSHTFALVRVVSEMWTNEDQVTGHINQHQFKFCHVVGKSCHFLQKMVDISKMVARQ